MSSVGYKSSALRPDDDDDLYSGFENMGTTQVSSEVQFLGQSQPTAVPMTATYGTSDGLGPRPMTSVKGAGFKSGTGALSDDPLGKTPSSAPALQKKSESGPEYLAKELEREINNLIEGSALSQNKANFVNGLEKAKLAVKKERVLHRHREKHKKLDQMNPYLSFAV